MNTKFTLFIFDPEANFSAWLKSMVSSLATWPVLVIHPVPVLDSKNKRTILLVFVISLSRAIVRSTTLATALYTFYSTVLDPVLSSHSRVHTNSTTTRHKTPA